MNIERMSVRQLKEKLTEAAQKLAAHDGDGSDLKCEVDVLQEELAIRKWTVRPLTQRRLRSAARKVVEHIFNEGYFERDVHVDWATGREPLSQHIYGALLTLNKWLTKKKEGK